jgi:hypothetical protein
MWADMHAPFEGTGYCYGPDGEQLDLRTIVTDDGPERWSDTGEPTIYLARDLGVALAEWGRHVDADDPPSVTTLWRIPVRLGRAVDLRSREVASRLGIPEDPRWFLDTRRCRDVARRLRQEGGADSLIVPSVAFLDDAERSNLVIFVDKLERGIADIGEPVPVGWGRLVSRGWADGAPAEDRRRGDPTAAARPDPPAGD